MKGSNGRRFKTRTKAYWKGLSYREWRANLGLYVLAVLIMVGPYVLGIWAARSSPQALREVVSAYTAGSPFGDYTALGGAILGLVSLWRDRSRDFAADVLDGPVGRRDFLLVKMAWLIGTVVAAGLAIGAMASWASVAGGVPGDVGPLAVWLLWQTAAGSAMALTALAMGTAMGSLAFAALGTAAWPVMPLAASSVIRAVYMPLNGFGQRFGPIWASAVSVRIQHLSPFAPTMPANGWGMVVYGLEFCLIAMLFGWAAIGWWSRAQIERMRDPMVFPFLWNLHYGLIGVLMALLVTMFALQAWDPGAHLTTTLIVWGTLSVFGWFVARWIVMLLGRTSLRWGPGASP